MDPLYHPTRDILRLASSISEKSAQVKTQFLAAFSPEWRKVTRVATVYATLKLNGQALAYEKMTALINNVRVQGPEKRIREATNVLKVYKSLKNLNPRSQDAFLSAHREMMKDICEQAGHYRTAGSGIFRGSEPIRLAPSPEEVLPRIEKLFNYLNLGEDLPLIKSCLFHYWVESTQPFEVASGIMGRLWQTLILMKEAPMFEFLSLEGKLYQNRKAYFRALTDSNTESDATKFVFFMLCMIDESLFEIMKNAPCALNATDRLLSFHEMGMCSFTRKDYMGIFKTISSATASRDLEKGVNAGLFEKYGTKNRTVYSCQKP